MIEILQDNNYDYDYVVDAIDTLSPKVFLIYHCVQMGLPLVSSMGSAGKFDPSLVEVSDVSKSHTCPLAYLVRKRLSRLGIKTGFKVVYSSERVPEDAMIEDPSTNKRTTIGCISYMPPIFGCYCASVVIRDILGR
jgi:tRNA A37 threonylcarbamoyladenosine dehydratase